MRTECVKDSNFPLLVAKDNQLSAYELKGLNLPNLKLWNIVVTRWSLPWSTGDLPDERSAIYQVLGKGGGNLLAFLLRSRKALLYLKESRAIFSLFARRQASYSDFGFPAQTQRTNHRTVKAPIMSRGCSAQTGIQIMVILEEVLRLYPPKIFLKTNGVDRKFQTCDL